jgi:hydroxypyruvate reductase
VSARPCFDDRAAHLAELRSAALQAADPAAAVNRALTPEDVSGADRVFVVGAGKAGVAMGRAAAQILGERLTAGLLSVPHTPAQAIDRLTFIEGGHPLPTAGTLAAGRALVELLASGRLTPRDLVLALISGGGSALLEWPRAGLRLEDLQAANAALLKCGAAIHEINVVRQQLSEIKGGGLLRLAQPARVLALILSDVVGNPLSLIASGPTVVPPVGGLEALAIVEKYGLASRLPAPVWQCLSTPRSPAAEAQPASVVNRLIASNRLAGEAAAARARELGFEAIWLADDWQGEAREVGRRFAARLLERAAVTGAPERPLALIAGGETTVTVRGEGKGGRNQELALAAAWPLAGRAGCVIATLATDGVDGPTDAAGAVVTGATLERSQTLGLDAQAYLDDNNAYGFFAALGDLVLTGPTGTNVNDLIFGLRY